MKTGCSFLSNPSCVLWLSSDAGELGLNLNSKTMLRERLKYSVDNFFSSDL